MNQYAQKRLDYAKKRLQELKSTYSITGKNWEESAKTAIEQAARLEVILEDLIKEMEEVRDSDECSESYFGKSS